MTPGIASQNYRKPRRQTPRGHSAEHWLAHTFNMSPATAKLIAGHLGYQPQDDDCARLDETATEAAADAVKHAKGVLHEQ